MSDYVVRLSGSQLANSPSLKNLISGPCRYTGRVFLVVSAYRNILDAVYQALEDALIIDINDFTETLHAFCRDVTKTDGSPSYATLVDQLGALLTGIKLIGDYSSSLRDQVAGFSEKLTCEIYKAQLEREGLSCEIMWPEQISLLANNDYGNATFFSVGKDKLQNLANGVYLIPGSYGITELGKVARAGKSAADYSAAFLTKELNVARLELWGIDQPFMRADPQIVPNAPGIKRLTYSEASELAYFDHYSF